MPETLLLPPSYSADANAPERVSRSRRYCHPLNWPIWNLDPIVLIRHFGLRLGKSLAVRLFKRTCDGAGRVDRKSILTVSSILEHDSAGSFSKANLADRVWGRTPGFVAQGMLLQDASLA